MMYQTALSIGFVVFTLAACVGAEGPGADVDVNEALTATGEQRYCGQGRPFVEGDHERTLFTRLTLRPDGAAAFERILVRRDAPPVAFADRAAPLIETVPWRGTTGYPRLIVERVDPRLSLAERGRPAEPKVRQAIRARVAYSEARRGPPQTMIPCVNLNDDLKGELASGPRWQLDASLGAAEYRRRAAGAAGAHLAPAGWVGERPRTASDRATAWCAVGLEFDSFEPRRLRRVTFLDGGARLDEFIYDGRRAEISASAPAHLQPAADERATALYIDLNRPDFTDGWFRSCDDPALREYLVPFAGVAF